jgi:hypothetical protein
MILNDNQAKTAASALLFFWIGAIVFWLKRVHRKTPAVAKYVYTKIGVKRVYDIPKRLCTNHVVGAAIRPGKLAIVDNKNCEHCALIKAVRRL